MKDVLTRKKPEPVLPVGGRTKGDEYLVPAAVQAPAQIDEVPLRPAIVPCR